MEHKKTFFEYVPVYLKEIRRFIDGKEYVTNILNCIINLGINFAAIDANFNEKEAKVIAEYKQIAIQKFIGYYNILANDYNEISSKGKKIEKKNIEPERRNLNNILADFDELIGLKKVKLELHTLINLSRINHIRKLKKLPVVSMSNHLVFSR